MKCYFLSCRNARKEKILLQLKKRQHFVEGYEMYSVQDLLDVRSGDLMVELEGVVDVFRRHIKTNCEICRGNGFICELCTDEDVIFPFDDYVSICRTCYAVFHRLCFEKRRKDCPRCRRREQRRVSRDAEPVTPDTPSTPDVNTKAKSLSAENSTATPSQNAEQDLNESYDSGAPPVPNNSLNPFDVDDGTLHQEPSFFDAYDDTLNPFSR